MKFKKKENSENFGHKKSISKPLFLLLFLFIIIPIASAPPTPQDSANPNTGIDIESPIIESHQINRDFTFHLHAHNVSNGLILTNTTTQCNMHLYSNDGSHLYQSDMEFDSPLDFELDILAGNFSTQGQYAVVFYCNATNIGGFFEYGFDVTPSGDNKGTSNTSLTLILILIAYAIGFIGFFGKNEIVSLIGGLFMLSLSVYMINQGIFIYRDWITNALAYFTMALGAYFTVVAAFALVNDK